MAKKGDISTGKAIFIVMVALLDDMAAIALVILVLRVFDVDISWPGLVAVGLVLGTLVFIVHRAIVPSLRRRKVAGAEGMMGLEGEVTQALRPKGIVKVKSEYWKAYSDGSNIDKGETVEIVGIKGLNLEVKRKDI